MDTTPVRECAGCGRTILPRTAHRAQPLPRVHAESVGGDMCRPCYRRAGRTTDRAKPIPRELVLTDWQWLHETGELDAGDSLAHRVQVAAPRMGMSPDTLEKALQRAGIRNPAEPGLRWDKIKAAQATGSGCPQCRNHATTVTRGEAEVRRLARMLAARPDDAHLADQLDAARAHLAREQAERDWHTEYGPHEGDDVEVAA